MRGKKNKPQSASFATFAIPTQAQLEADVFGTRAQDAWEKFQDLTQRERQVSLLMADCLKNREIAGRLGISPKTLDIHRTNIFRKLGTKTLAHVARVVYFVRILQLIGIPVAQSGYSKFELSEERLERQAG